MMADGISRDPIEVPKLAIREEVSARDLAYSLLCLEEVTEKVNRLEHNIIEAYDHYTPHFGVLYTLGDVVESLEILRVGTGLAKFEPIIDEVLDYDNYLKNGYLPELLARSCRPCEDGEPEFVILDVKQNKVHVITPHGQTRFGDVSSLRDNRALPDDDGLVVWRI
jgi:hypothetical protein